MNETALQRAERILGRYGIAELCDCTYSAVQQWTNNGVPPKHCLKIEQATREKGEPVTCQDLRPDVFGAPASTPQAAAAVARA